MGISNVILYEEFICQREGSLIITADVQRRGKMLLVHTYVCMTVGGEICFGRTCGQMSVNKLINEGLRT